MSNQKEKRTFKDFKALIDEYFNNCERDNILPLFPELLLHLDISLDSWNNYLNPPSIDNLRYKNDIDYRRRMDNKYRYAAEAKKAELRLEAAISRVATTTNKPTGAIFLLKQPHYGGYTDKQITEVGGTDVPITINLKTSSGEDFKPG